jgi:hypothetical protein
VQAVASVVAAPDLVLLADLLDVVEPLVLQVAFVAVDPVRVPDFVVVQLHVERFAELVEWVLVAPVVAVDSVRVPDFVVVQPHVEHSAAPVVAVSQRAYCPAPVSLMELPRELDLWLVVAERADSRAHLAVVVALGVPPVLPVPDAHRCRHVAALVSPILVHCDLVPFGSEREPLLVHYAELEPVVHFRRLVHRVP